MKPEVVWLACCIARFRVASPQYDEAIAAPTPSAAPSNWRRGGARAAPAKPPVTVLATRPRKTVRSGAVFILSPAISAAAIATPPAATRGRPISRVSGLSCGSVPRRAAPANAASGAIERWPATRPIRIERSMKSSYPFACNNAGSPQQVPELPRGEKGPGRAPLPSPRLPLVRHRCASAHVAEGLEAGPAKQKSVNSVHVF